MKYNIKLPSIQPREETIKKQLCKESHLFALQTDQLMFHQIIGPFSSCETGRERERERHTHTHRKERENDVCKKSKDRERERV